MRNLATEQLENQQFVVIVPAAGVGKRMLASRPKQYLSINNEAILSHTLNRLLSHERIAKVIIVLSDDDDYFVQTALADNPDIIRVSGGNERVDSVLNGLKAVQSNEWVLIHDAARPCITHDDIDKLITHCLSENSGGLLAAQVVDTMKQAKRGVKGTSSVGMTIERCNLWHAFTPQMFKAKELKQAIESALAKGVTITDESSAIECAGLPSSLIPGRRDNIKITRPEDLVLASFYLEQQVKEQLTAENN